MMYRTKFMDPVDNVATSIFHWIFGLDVLLIHVTITSALRCRSAVGAVLLFVESFTDDGMI